MVKRDQANFFLRGDQARHRQSPDHLYLLLEGVRGH